MPPIRRRMEEGRHLRMSSFLHEFDIKFWRIQRVSGENQLPPPIYQDNFYRIHHCPEWFACRPEIVFYQRVDGMAWRICDGDGLVPGLQSFVFKGPSGVVEGLAAGHLRAVFHPGAHICCAQEIVELGHMRFTRGVREDSPAFLGAAPEDFPDLLVDGHSALLGLPPLIEVMLIRPLLKSIW
jgi:hypothetical protein